MTNDDITARHNRILAKRVKRVEYAGIAFAIIAAAAIITNVTVFITASRPDPIVLGATAVTGFVGIAAAFMAAYVRTMLRPGENR